MSRTFRKSSPRLRSRWFGNMGSEPSKPLSIRFKANDGKHSWRCRCEDYCVQGWRHKHLRRNHPLYHGEIDDGLLHRLHSEDGNQEA